MSRTFERDMAHSKHVSCRAGGSNNTAQRNNGRDFGIDCRHNISSYSSPCISHVRARAHTHTHTKPRPPNNCLCLFQSLPLVYAYTRAYTHTHTHEHTCAHARAHTHTHAHAHLTHKVLPRHVCWLALFENAIKTNEYSSIYQHSRSLVNLGTVTLVYLLGFTCAFRSVSDVFQMWNRDCTWTKRDV